MFKAIRVATHFPNGSPGVALPRGLAPRIARFTFAFLPSMIGFGSLQARSALILSPIITYVEGENKVREGEHKL